MMKFKIVDIVVGLVLAGLLISTCLVLTGVKPMPLLVILLFAAITLITFIINTPKISTALFYILIGIMLLTCYTTAAYWLKEIINPHRDLALANGRYVGRVTDMSWIWGVLFGLILAAFTIRFYHKRVERNRFIEIAATAIFMIVTFCIWLTC